MPSTLRKKNEYKKLGKGENVFEIRQKPVAENDVFGDRGDLVDMLPEKTDIRIN